MRLSLAGVSEPSTLDSSCGQSQLKLSNGRTSPLHLPSGMNENPPGPQTDPEIVPVPEQTQDGVPPVCKSRLFTWRLLGAVLALLVVLGWVFIIVMLILEEKWQLVLVAWLLLYSAAHFCYWYCKRHSLLSLRRQLGARADSPTFPALSPISSRFFAIRSRKMRWVKYAREVKGVDWSCFVRRSMTGGGGEVRERERE
ncbi:hypothetical protein O3P69_005894 [Scylla paramamosain]|uniref:Uncharacterized protein n=1 Tax=Scylla paramamosain TaxID=85552 RepID=A0AAW0U3V7_SCYPA